MAFSDANIFPAYPTLEINTTKPEATPPPLASSLSKRLSIKNPIKSSLQASSADLLGRAREIIGRAGGLIPVTGLFDPSYRFSENVVGYGTRHLQLTYAQVFGSLSLSYFY